MACITRGEKEVILSDCTNSQWYAPTSLQRDYQSKQKVDRGRWGKILCANSFCEFFCWIQPISVYIICISVLELVKANSVFNFFLVLSDKKETAQHIPIKKPKVESVLYKVFKGYCYSLS